MVARTRGGKAKATRTAMLSYFLLDAGQTSDTLVGFEITSCSFTEQKVTQNSSARCLCLLCSLERLPKPRDTIANHTFPQCQGCRSSS